MRIIQSFWSKPFLETKENAWFNRKLFLYSQAISLFHLKNLGYEVCFYTDNKGVKIFLDNLNLPFNQVHIALNNLEDTSLWTQGKIKTYSLQKEPFIHIDSDVFLNHRIELPNTKNYLLCQSYYDRKRVLDLLVEKNNLPEFLKEGLNFSVCMGVFATDNLEFIKQYCTSYKEYSANWKIHDDLKPYKNTILEEWLLTHMAIKQNVPLKYLFDVDSIKNLKKFEELAKEVNYTHIGGYKINNLEFYKHMIEFCKNKMPAVHKAIQNIRI